jgi:methyl-accepting chemotaxis protein
VAFNDVAEPVSQLRSPDERTESILGQPFSNPGSFLDWASPSHIVNEFVKTVVGYDLYGEAAKVFAGDWELVWRAAGAFRNLGNAMQDLGINVSHGNVELDAAWDGNANDAAFMYFADLSSAISSQRIALTELADKYEQAAEGTFRIGESVSGLMKDITDAAMIGAVAASAGTATIETGVGFVTGWGIAAYEAYKIAEMADKARKLIATASAVIGTVVGEIQSLSAETGVLSRYPLPGVGYRHPDSRHQ